MSQDKAFSIKPVETQVAILRDVFPEVALPDLSFPSTYVTPLEADGWFASFGFRRGDTVAAHVAWILERAGDRLPLKDIQGELLDPLQPSKIPFEGIWKSMAVRRAMVAGMQGSPDVILYPGQFAGRHRGNCLGLVAVSHCKPYEAFLSVADVLCMLLTHPERLRDLDDGVLLCGADRLRSEDGRAKVPAIFCRDGKLHLLGFEETDAIYSASTPTAFQPSLLTASCDA